MKEAVVDPKKVAGSKEARGDISWWHDIDMLEEARWKLIQDDGGIEEAVEDKIAVHSHVIAEFRLSWKGTLAADPKLVVELSKMKHDDQRFRDGR